MTDALLSDEDATRLEVELARRMSLAEFVQESWPILESVTPLVWSWHIEAVCDHVQEVMEGWLIAMRGGPKPQRQRFKIQIPPGSMKSRVLSVCAPAWMWIREPAWSVICLSANPRVALRDAMKARQLIKSEWYQHKFQPEWSISDEQDAKGNYYTTAGGRRQSMGWSAGIIGDRADAILVDDPIDAKKVTKAALQKVNDDYDDAVQNRVNDPLLGLIFLIMQRLDMDDLVGHTDGHEGWVQMCLPQEFEPARRCVMWTGWEDPRTEEGELLIPARFTRAYLDEQKIILGPAGYAAQHQQRPAPAAGNIFQRASFQKRWTQETLPPVFDLLWASVDPANAEVPTSWVVIQFWGSCRGQRYLLDQVRGRFSPMTTENTIKDCVTRWKNRHGRVDAIIMEAKAAGPFLKERLQMEIPGILPWPPKGTQMGSKEERAAGVEPQVASGNVWIPDPSMDGFRWVLDFIEEVVTFPFYGSDDQVDAFTQGLQYAQQHSRKMISLGDDFAKRGVVQSRWKMW